MPQNNVDSLRATLRGEIIEPGDTSYEAARRVYNAMIDRRPRLIARCADAADVIASVNFAREHALPLAVRGGGHSGPGLGVCDDGVVIDLSPMRGVRVDPHMRTARVAGGCLWRDVDTYPTLQQAFDPLYPPGLQWYWRGDFIREISDAAIAAHIEHASSIPSAPSTMHLYPIDGAVHRVAADATAFAFRDAHWSQVIVGVDPSPSRAGEMKRWTRGYWSALHPYSAGAGYINFLMDEEEDRVRATYRQNFDRLSHIKAKYDPNNLFRINQNILPSLQTPKGITAVRA
jgi:FAD/FMN-containing dehydrogenase